MGPMLSILRADCKDSHPKKKTSKSQVTRSKTAGSTGNWGRRREDPIGERARTPSIPDNAFTAIATSPCKCSTGTKPSVRKDTFNVRPRLSLGRTYVIQAPFRSTVRVSLRASAADNTLPPRPGRQSSPHTLSELGTIGRTPPPTVLLVVKHGVL